MVVYLHFFANDNLKKALNLSIAKAKRVILCSKTRLAYSAVWAVLINRWAKNLMPEKNVLLVFVVFIEASGYGKFLAKPRFAVYFKLSLFLREIFYYYYFFSKPQSNRSARTNNIRMYH